MTFRAPIALLALVAMIAPVVGQPVADKGPSAAFTPLKAPVVSDYSGLAENSPFTIRPDPVVSTPEEPFPDIKLIGYMSLGGKMNAWVQPADKEDPIQLVEGIRDEASGLLLLGIKGAENMFTAAAEIETNGKTGTLRFTEAGISLASGAGAAKPAAQGQNPNPAPNRPPAPGMERPSGPLPTTTPRRRIVLPQ
ncbi:MAG: hypothetical protein ACKO2G_15040 [Verrucomicrobiales bacterium]